MRVWDIPPERLCRNHLLGEHREIHAIWSILTKDKKGYSKHPETKRWRGKLKALYKRHDQLVKEMRRRGYKHCSGIDSKLANGRGTQDEYVNSRKEQVRILRNKNCGCKV